MGLETSLDEHLDNCYAETERVPSKIGSLQAFREHMRDDGELMAKARVRLGELNSDVVDRCHVSRVYKAILERALA